MKITVSVIKADIGPWEGILTSEKLLETVRRHVQEKGGIADRQLCELHRDDVPYS